MLLYILIYHNKLSSFIYYFKNTIKYIIVVFCVIYDFKMSNKNIKKEKQYDENYEFITCKLCGHKSHNLTWHIIKYHKMTTREYKDLFRCNYVYSPYLVDKIKKHHDFFICKNDSNGNHSCFSKNSIYYNKEKWEKSIQKIKESTKKSKRTNKKLDYWLKKTNGNIDEAEKLLKERFSTFSLKKCIKKYGEQEGYKIWENRQIKWKKSLQKKLLEDNYINLLKFISKEENELLTELNKKLNNALESQFTFSNKKIKNLNHVYFYDIGYEEKKKIIEFNGDYWHCNPNKYNPNSYVTFPKGTIQAKDVWINDKKKIDFATKNGYEVKIVWEEDWLNNKEKIINECINFLKN